MLLQTDALMTRIRLKAFNFEKNENGTIMKDHRNTYHKNFRMYKSPPQNYLLN